MRILVDNGAYHLRNLGDIAMLQVTVDRLGQLLPGAELAVVTADPARLAVCCPTAVPAPLNLREAWAEVYGTNGVAVRGLRRWPAALRLRAECFEESIRHAAPGVAAWVACGVRRCGRVLRQRAAQWVRFVQDCDAVVASGGGYITEEYVAHSLQMLNLMEWAACLGKPTAMFGQGLGPVYRPVLLAKGAHALRRVDLISLRERTHGPALLERLRVASRRWMVTGDDAIESAWLRRPADLGPALGLNIRLTTASAVGREQAVRLEQAVLAAASDIGGEVARFPIASADERHDGDSALASMGPTEAIERIGRCRLVVTGSYHGAVFALAQGVPAIGLTASEYYRQKFGGLAEMFGGGCEVIRLEEGEPIQRLRSAIARWWDQAPRMRAGLLEAAARQIEASRAAYERFAELLR